MEEGLLLTVVSSAQGDGALSFNTTRGDVKDVVSALTLLLESPWLCRGGEHVLQPFKRRRKEFSLSGLDTLFFMADGVDYGFVQALDWLE